MRVEDRDEVVRRAAAGRSPTEVAADFAAVVDGFTAWLRGRSDADMGVLLGVDRRGGSPAPADGRWWRRADEVPAAAEPQALWDLLVGPWSRVGHWRHHLPDLRACLPASGNGPPATAG